MVNTNIQGPIPIEGQGLTYKPSGNYGKGEFPEFKNLEWYDSVIRTRRPINPCQDGDVAALYSYQTLSKGFIGEDQGAAAAVSPTDNWIVGAYGRKVYKTSWAPSLLPQPASPDPVGYNMQSGHFIVGFFRYNDVPYWVTNKVQLNSYNEIWIFKGDAGFSYKGQTTLPSTSVKVANVGQPYTNQFKRVFVHKDRIFLVTSNKVFFSKATDPMTWTTPDGGFIGIEQGTINDAIGLNDTIFITSTYKTYSYTYSIDPNSDSSLRPIASGTEYTALTVSGNDVYVAGYNSVYQINNNSIQLIKNLNEVTLPVEFKKITKLAVLGDTLFVLRAYTNSWRGFINPPANATDLLSINLLNGTVNVIEFRDNLDLPPNGADGFNYWARGLITDMITPAPLDRDIPAIYFAVSHYMETGSPKNFRTRFYFMNESHTTPAQVGSDNIEIPASNSGMDRIVKSDNTVVKARIEMALRLENFTPDGSEYLQKRFRSLLIEGKIPSSDTTTNIDLLFDGTSVAVSTSGWPYRNTSLSNRVPPFPYRIRINQKSKTLGIYIYTVPQGAGPIDPTPGTYRDENSPYFFFINDMRTYWNYTADM